MSLVAVTRSRLQFIRGCCLSHMTTLAVAPACGWIVFVSSLCSHKKIAIKIELKETRRKTEL